MVSSSLSAKKHTHTPLVSKCMGLHPTPSCKSPTYFLQIRRTVKAILTDDVDGTGYRGEYVEIRGGFMRNLLFPTKRAIYATDENRRIYEAVDRVSDAVFHCCCC